MHTEVDVPNPIPRPHSGPIRGGIFTLEQKNNALAAPLQAVSQTNDQSTVLLVDPNNTLQERRIALGMQTATDAEVLSGLQEGDSLVVSDRAGLKSGRHVIPQVDRLGSISTRDEQIGELLEKAIMSRFSIRNPYFIVVHLPGADGHRSHQPGADAGGSVSHHQSARSCGGDLLFRHAAAGYRDRHHQSPGALLHAGLRHRSHGIAFAAGRKHHQGVLPARHQTRTPMSPSFPTLRWRI